MAQQDDFHDNDFDNEFDFIEQDDNVASSSKINKKFLAQNITNPKILGILATSIAGGAIIFTTLIQNKPATAITTPPSLLTPISPSALPDKTNNKVISKATPAPTPASAPTPAPALPSIQPPVKEQPIENISITTKPVETEEYLSLEQALGSAHKMLKDSEESLFQDTKDIASKPEITSLPHDNSINNSVSTNSNDINALKQSLQTITDDTNINVNQIRQLEFTTQDLQKNLKQLTQTITNLDTKVSSLNEIIENLSQELNSVKKLVTEDNLSTTKTPMQLSQPNYTNKHNNSSQMTYQSPEYVVYAIIPGRAWLKTTQGQIITVAEGDTLGDYGKIAAIDAATSTVRTSAGVILR